MMFSSFIPTLIKGYLKSKYRALKIKWIFSSKEGGMLLKKCFMVESLLFLEARAGAGEKKSGAR